MAPSVDLLLRLCRSTVRKGSAFPAGTGCESREATPREIRGIAAGRRYSISITFSLAAILFGLTPAMLAQQPTASPSPMVSAQQTLTVPTIAIDYRADANRPLPELRREGVDAN